ncbi:hypothetical protein E0L21_22280 [Kosakonia quasisacchari]|uniref:Uncharacterized protein n=1 Tax=Kosakonia quasisacchari TaxID=2529380 RepID=A0A4R0GKW0_9ENTR|nr:hypothetical protein E0L21_22280 [Kosakonia quasisacchari]
MLRRCNSITSVIVTSCYIANNNFTHRPITRQVNSLNRSVRIISDMRKIARNSGLIGSAKPASINDIDNQAFLLQLKVRFRLKG